MAVQMKEKEVKSFDNVFAAEYCSLQHLLPSENRIGYTAGVYGWNADVYHFVVDDKVVVICTGYRPVGKRIPYDICKKYNDASKDASKEERKELLRAFLQEVIGGVQ